MGGTAKDLAHEQFFISGSRQNITKNKQKNDRKA
jgi:hypothetical protein